MLSLNNDVIRPEVACATPLGGKDYTCCIASNMDKRRWRITVALLDACTNYVGKVNRLDFYRFPMADRGRAAKSGSCAQEPSETEIHFKVGWLG